MDIFVGSDKNNTDGHDNEDDDSGDDGISLLWLL